MLSLNDPVLLEMQITQLEFMESNVCNSMTVELLAWVQSDKTYESFIAYAKQRYAKDIVAWFSSMWQAIKRRDIAIRCNEDEIWLEFLAIKTQLKDIPYIWNVY